MRVKQIGFRPTDNDIAMLEELKENFSDGNPMANITNADILRLALRTLHFTYFPDDEKNSFE